MTDAPPPPSGTSGDGAGGPRRAAVLGSPVAHSLSPAMHRAAYAAMALDGWTYDARDVTETELPAVLAACGPEWAGLSLTMPLKRAVLPLLGELDEVARATGVVNTVTWRGEGAAREALGANTDVEGIAGALSPLLAAAPEHGVVLGGGATGVSAVAALASLGCRRVVALVRSPERAAALREVGARSGVAVALEPFAEAAARTAAADVVVSTAPAGAADALAAEVAAASGGGHRGVLLDVVYDPWPTALAAAWRGPVVDGFEMLVRQAVGQVRLMTGAAPSPDLLREAGRAEPRRRAAATPAR
ncbi:shikimate dehydrogenase [Pseudokineococcus marinus]|uniref:shikimate dehydrogenase n=1 Tax=Pseudokineococcus marinus TaxID=351215 RepID=UPI0031CF9011